MTSIVRRGACALVLLAATPATLPAQEIRVVDPGPRGAGRPLVDVLAGPHELRVTNDTLVQLPRGESFERSIVIIGARRVTVASRVQGSVIVIGGDLFLHPGVELAGDAVAYGGGVYLTSLGRWRRHIAHRTFTYELGGSPGAYTLRYRPITVLRVPPFELPGLSGIRIPLYDRANGLSLPWGPRLNSTGGRFTLDLVGTYRSDLGAVDPELSGTAQFTRLSAVTVVAGRTTLTNEEWIHDALLNSIGALFAGNDVRNYRRADRAEVMYRRDIELAAATLTPHIGALVEDAWSVGPEVGTTSNPWSVVNRTDTLDGMRRPNPPVTRGRISSGVAGMDLEGTIGDIDVTSTALLEVPAETPDDSRYVQGTIDARLEFPTFRNHRFRFDAHATITGGDTPPPQRFTYLGGPRTLPTLELLSMGGDQVLFFESRYTVPIEQIVLPIIRSPSVSLRHMIGSAGIDRLPGFVNNLGIRLAGSYFKIDFNIDPESRDTDWSFGLSLGR